MKRSLAAVLVVSTASLVIGPISPRDALGAGFLLVSPAMRSQGMGSVGAADNSDPANAFFNPAVIGSVQGAFLTAGYNSSTYSYTPTSATDINEYNVGAGAGIERSFGDDMTGFFGAGVRYSSYSSEQSFASSTPYDDDESYATISLGAGCLLGDALYTGAGFALKPWREKAGFPPAEEHSKTAYDFGLLARMRILRTDGMTLSSGLGVSFLNLGGEITSDQVLPKTYRYGFALQFEKGSSQYCRAHFCVDVPVLAASIVYDYVDDRIQAGNGYGNEWGLGGEVALLQILYLRAGYNHFSTGQDYPSFGVGIGIGYQSFRARFDIADVGQIEGDTYTDEYGLSLGFSY